MAFRIANYKNVLAIALVFAVAGSFVVLNLRVRDHGWRTELSGWPFLAVSQKSNLVVHLKDGDFTGNEPANTPVLPRKAWIVFGRPFTIVPLPFAANVGTSLCVVLATIILAERWRRGRWAVSLLSLFVWITWVGVLLAVSRVSHAEAEAAFWSYRWLPQIDWLDIACFTFIAAGCTFATYCGRRLFGRVESVVRLIRPGTGRKRVAIAKLRRVESKEVHA